MGRGDHEGEVMRLKMRKSPGICGIVLEMSKAGNEHQC